jgi:membrane protein
MASPVARAKAALAGARSRSRVLDHGVRTQEHYAWVNGSALAGAMTYYAFLSFFPILALAFFAVGYIARVYPEARDNLIVGINSALPGLLGPRGISIKTVEDAAATVGLLGLLGLLYTGLNWLSAMRTALQTVFELPRNLRPGFVTGKLRDLASLLVVGATLLLSVAVTGAVVAFSDKVLELLGLGAELSWLVQALGALVGVATSTLLFYAFYRLLARSRAPRRVLWHGALLGAIGFEVLKQISSYLLAATRNAPAFQAFGIALILLVWINYFSRIVVYAAAWAHSSPAARAARTTEATPTSPDVPALRAPVATPHPVGPQPGPRVAFGAGAATALGLVALMKRLRR